MQIAEHLGPIVRDIASNPITSIVAPTGSGKSIGVPAIVAVTGARCFVSVPTVTGATSLASYQKAVQASLNNPVSVGFAAEGNIQYGDQDQIVYCTSGHLRRKLLSYFYGGRNNPINFCQVLIVDEVHTGSLDNTVILSLWLRAAAMGEVPRLVLMSATPVPVPFLPAPKEYIVQSQGAFGVTIQYLSRDIAANTSNRGQVETQVYQETAALVARVHGTTPISDGSMLVFAPGSAEIQTIQDLLVSTHRISKAMIVPAFGSMKQEEILRLYQDPPKDVRKIVIATNIAESTITIDGLGFVFDTLLEKRAETSLTGGLRLVLTSITQDSANQRAGRTGRTRPGVCYRMTTPETFANLEKHRSPEIERIPLHSVIMELLDVGLSPLGTLRTIQEERLQDSLRLLASLGMIIRRGPLVTNVTVTDKGHFAPNFPLSVKNAALLWEWRAAGHALFPGVVMISLIDCYGPSYYWYPRRDRDQTEDQYDTARDRHYERYFERFQGLSDVESLARMWGFFMNEIKGFERSRDVRLVNEWAYNNSINAKKLREALQIIQQCIRSLDRMNPSNPVVPGKFTTEGVIKALKPLVARVYSEDLLRRNPHRDTYSHPSTGHIFKLDTRNALNTFNALNGTQIFRPPVIAPLLTAEIAGARGSVRIVSVALDVDPPPSLPPVPSYLEGTQPGLVCPPPSLRATPYLGHQPQTLPRPQPINITTPLPVRPSLPVPTGPPPILPTTPLPPPPALYPTTPANVSTTSTATSVTSATPASDPLLTTSPALEPSTSSFGTSISPNPQELDTTLALLDSLNV